MDSIEHPVWCNDHQLDDHQLDDPERVSDIIVHRCVLLHLEKVAVEVEQCLVAGILEPAGVYLETRDRHNRFPAGGMILDPAEADQVGRALQAAARLLG